ncbi:aminotransferase class V-fold PLP-dependent enzyme [candidate division KSB1 bacterium]
MTFEEVRKSFPGLSDKVYLDAAAVSLTPVQTQEGIERFLELALRGESKDKLKLHMAMDKMREEAIEEAAKLLNTQQKNIALVESTTHGLNIAANALPLKKGDNVLIADTEYLQVAIPWAKKAESIGIGIKPVRSHDEGVLLPEDFEKAIDANTKAVCVSSVQWCSGYRLNMKRISEICWERNIRLVVDAVQEMGAMQIDLSSQYADFLVAGGHKWLNSPYGCGVMFVADRVINDLTPASYGYLALDPPKGGWPVYFRTPDITPYREYTFPRTAKTFEIGGTANYPGAVGLGKSLKLFNDVGPEAVENHIHGLTGLLHDELENLGAHVVSKRTRENRSGITIFRIERSHEEDLALAEKIMSERIFISIRYTSNVGGIRASTHLYNNKNDIMRLIEAIKKHRT